MIILKEIQGSTYELKSEEIYNKEELDLIQKSMKETVTEFADDIFENSTEIPFSEFKH